MKKIVGLKLKENSYDIVIGTNILGALGSQLRKMKIGKDAVIITNPIIKKHYGRLIAEGLKKKGISVKFIEIPSGEKSKSAFYAQKIIEQIVSYDVFKTIFIVALGGGVVGDLAGYVAAVYKRGIPYVQIPTTLLAQIDSSIGGKVAIDLPVGKNLIGAFYQPKVVWSDVSVLSTLDNRQIINGFAEAVKYGIIYDQELFDYIDKNCEKLLKLEKKSLAHVVAVCSEIKAHVVSQDERETKGIRTILNFGHTIGHAIETAAAYDQYHHGEAIGLGMRIAADISLQLGMASPETVKRINQVLSTFHLPESLKHVQLNNILKVMKNDKKFISGKNRFVLVKEIGEVQVREGIPLDVIKRCVKKYLSS